MGFSDKFSNRPRIRKGISNASTRIAGKVVQSVQPIALENAKINCPHCASHPTIIGVEGEVRCPNCNARYFEWNPTSILTTEYKNVAEEDQYRFGVLLFQIAELIEEGQLEEAEEKCREAFEISTKTAEVWIFWAYFSYFNRPKEDQLKDNVHQIRWYLDRADTFSNSDIVTPIRQSIAYHLYHFLRKKIDTQIQKKEHEGYHQESISTYLVHLKICYAIYNDIYFLKELVNHFYGQKQFNWFDYEVKDLFLDKIDFISRIVGKHQFSAPDLDQIIQLIRQKDPDYLPPQILGGDFLGKVKKPLNDLLIYQKKRAENIEEEQRIAQIEAEEERLETEARKARAKEIAQRNRIYVIVGFAIFLIIVIFLLVSYFWYILFFGLLFLAIFKTKLDPN